MFLFWQNMFWHIVCCRLMPHCGSFQFEILAQQSMAGMDASMTDPFVKFDDFMAWMANKYGMEDDVNDELGSDEDDSIDEEDRAVLQDMLAQSSGQYGDIHLVDLTSVVNRRRTAASSDTARPRRVRRTSVFAGMVRKANEKLQMVKNALRFTTQTNNCFPAFDEDQLIKFVQLMYKQVLSTLSPLQFGTPAAVATR